jgi:hypothetical protein
LGGFVWAWTHCAACNNLVGSGIEATLKRDDSIRHALERELAREIPEIANSFAEGQRYLAQSDSGNLDASFRRGSFELGTTRLDESLIQDHARSTISRDHARARRVFGRRAPRGA